MKRFPKMTAAREASACRYLRLLQRTGMEPFALAWVYDQVGCRFTLLVLATGSEDGGPHWIGDYHAAVQAILAQDHDAPSELLAIDERHPRGAALRRAIALLRHPGGSPQALGIGHFILMRSWIHHARFAPRAPPPKWRSERFE